MTTRTLRLPIKPSFWQEWLRDPPEFNGLQDDGDVSDAISDVINREFKSAEQPAAVVWYMTQGREQETRKTLAVEAAERWLDLCEIAAGETRDPRADQIVADMRATWADVEARFDWENAL